MLNQIAMALGISPAKKVIDFVPNKEETITFNLINNENRDLRVFAEVAGELAEYIRVLDGTVTINKNEKSKELNLEIILPENFERPGLFESTIKVSQVSDVDGGVTRISIVPSLKAKLQLRVPYPYKYIESRLIVDKDNRKVRFVMPIFNYGSGDLDNVKAFLKIFNAKNDLIKELETNSISIGSQKQAKLSAGWNADNIGSYYAIASIDYDGEKLELKESFDIGAPFVNITKIIVNNFRLGDIAKFDIYLKSDWNDIINVYADATIFKDDKIYLSSKTEPIDLFVGEENIINLYWGTANVAEGDYNLSLTIKHMLGESTHIVKLVVNEDSIITSLTPERIVSGRDIIIYLTVAIVILIVVNVLWYIKKFRKR
jgi:hypothetical protein